MNEARRGPAVSRARRSALILMACLAAAVVMTATASAEQYYAGSLAPSVEKSNSAYSYNWTYTKFNDKTPSSAGSYGRVAFIKASDYSWTCSAYSDFANFGCFLNTYNYNKHALCKNIWTNSFSYIACSQQ